MAAERINIASKSTRVELKIKQIQMNTNRNFTHTDGGPLSLNNMKINCWRTYLQSHLQTSPQTPQKAYPKFSNPGTTFPPKTCIVGGVMVVPEINLLWES